MLEFLALVGATSSSSSSGGSAFGSLLLFVPLILIVYWFLLRPQQQRSRKQRDLASNLSVGDEVMTTSGMYGIVREVEDESVVIEISEGVEVRFVKAAVSRKLTEPVDNAKGAGSSK